MSQDEWDDADLAHYTGEYAPPWVALTQDDYRDDWELDEEALMSPFYGTPTQYPPDPDDPILGISQWLHEHKILHCFYHSTDPPMTSWDWPPEPEGPDHWVIAIPCNQLGDTGFHMFVLVDDRGIEWLRLICTNHTTRVHQGRDLDDESEPGQRNGVRLFLADPDFFNQLETVSVEFGLRQITLGECIRDRTRKLAVAIDRVKRAVARDKGQ